MDAVIAASMSIKNSKKVKQMLEIILAFGNYLNGSKRGAVYGIKLQSLDMVSNGQLLNLVKLSVNSFESVYHNHLFHLLIGFNILRFKKEPHNLVNT